MLARFMTCAVLGVFWVSGCAYADGTDCIAVLPEVKRSFQGIDSELSADSIKQLELIGGCADKNSLCVIASSEPDGIDYVVLSGNSPAAFKDSKNLAAVTAFGAFENKHYGKVCALVTYSGGSAAAWAVEAWSVSDGKSHLIDGSTMLSITGEAYTPEGLLRKVAGPISRLR